MNCQLLTRTTCRAHSTQTSGTSWTGTRPFATRHITMEFTVPTTLTTQLLSYFNRPTFFCATALSQSGWRGCFTSRRG
ncbi:hypothetical protein ANCCAN_16430 [Ancylostoma caninum]|uniref:Uncharacterized protein n=1 Tax=Ancylostoma caninum TaxID=29170 RepID=A0A368FZK4_ANCCA|nr:hypothetical protein ANCCAN_16430 [Ancylostoma caninum]